MRLVRSIDGIAEDDVAAFFGFDRGDMSFVLSEVVTQGYIDRREGRLWLTNEGHSLFRDGSSDPAIFEVEQRQDEVGSI